MTTLTAGADATPTLASRVSLFNVEIDTLTFDQTIDRAFQFADRGGVAQHVVLNAAKVVQMAHDDRLRQIIAGCDLVNADGQAVVWASRILGRPLPERVAGIDMFTGIVERAAATGHRLFFLGATAEVLNEVLRRLRIRHPSLVIAGAHHGYWEDDAEIIRIVREAHPHFLFLAVPSPRKEFWLHRHLESLGVPFVMGVGGTFDVIAGRVRRAPRWVQRIGCEWAYRVAQEPRRMWKRYLLGNSAFVALTFKAWWQS